ncbi:MAG: class I SAM-dependent methyltransferase [Myxococcales bacterium]|nr:class I SAM-dependent methyltransferase [Myxococcales bacterium]
MLSRLDRLAYRSQHLGFLINATVLQEAARLVTRTPRPKVDATQLRALLRRRDELHARDLANVDAGMYPRELLFDLPVRQYMRALPQLMRDTPNVVRRMRRGDYKDIPAVDKQQYPAYYRRNFHWQTDGYFSDHSAEVYELGVELLFRGTADVMRRQIIPPITRHVQSHGGRERMRLLDIGCGTGRTLHQISRAHPAMQLHGVDLSPAYIRTARRRLADVAELTLAVENGEALPWADATFDIVTSTYMFHELPRNARRNVVREMLRVVKPGGLLVIEDSAQLGESAEIATALREFPREFHEPFYADYLEDDLGALVGEVGFPGATTEAHLVAKVVIARRPT